jgi:hypothetical protein
MMDRIYSPSFPKAIRIYSSYQRIHNWDIRIYPHSGKKSTFMGIVSKFCLPLLLILNLPPNQHHYTINRTSHKQKSLTMTVLISPIHNFQPSSWCIPTHCYLQHHMALCQGRGCGRAKETNCCLLPSPSVFPHTCCSFVCTLCFVCHSLVYSYSHCSPAIAHGSMRLRMCTNKLMPFSHVTFGLCLSHHISLFVVCCSVVCTLCLVVSFIQTLSIKMKEPSYIQMLPFDCKKQYC